MKIQPAYLCYNQYIVIYIIKETYLLNLSTIKFKKVIEF